MVATPLSTTPPATTASVSARHGLHAARAAEQPWRALDPDHIREIRTRALADPRGCRSKLPRWHRISGHRVITTGLYAGPPSVARYNRETGTLEILPGKSWVYHYDPDTGRREAVQEGTTCRTAWNSRRTYITLDLALILSTEAARAALRACKVDEDTFRRWVEHESLWAEADTGRRIVVRPGEVAKLMEVHKRTVQRCRAVGRLLGMYVTVYTGRMLTMREQIACRYKGSPQRGEAAESAFVRPASLWKTGTVAYLHRGPADGQNSSDRESLVTLKTQGEKGRTSSALTKKSRRRASPAFKLAKDVTKRLPWARKTHPSELAGLLHRFATANLRWTADDVVEHIDNVNMTRGWTSIGGPEDLRHPAYALLSKYLRDVDPVNDHPRLDLVLEAERRAAKLQEQRRARRAHAAGQYCDRDWCACRSRSVRK